MDIFILVKDFQEIIVGLMGVTVAGVIAFCFERRKTYLEDQTFKRDLFFRYNEKYNLINDDLVELSRIRLEADVPDIIYSNKPKLENWIQFIEDPENKESIKKIFDYLNLCAEEYYWHKKGFVTDDIWNCWKSGMLGWFKKNKLMQAVVRLEKIEKAPYYNTDFLDLFDDAIIDQTFLT